MIMYHYIAAFMYTLLNVSKPECIRFEVILESGDKRTVDNLAME